MSLVISDLHVDVLTEEEGRGLYRDMALIRRFDASTPIISMTSNSKPQDIMMYYNIGMNDFLPKPFTKEGLLDMLDVRLLFSFLV